MFVYADLPLLRFQGDSHIGITLWLIFAAAVWTNLRDRLPARSALPTYFAAGFLGCVTLLLSGFTAFDLLLYRHHSAETSTLLYDPQSNSSPFSPDSWRTSAPVSLGICHS
jgi:hypothetical protein